MSGLLGLVENGFGTGGWGTWSPPPWPPVVWPPLPPGSHNPCFAAGTKILTIRGEIAVEDIVVGDTVITVRADGPETRKVVWTGRRGIDISQHPKPELVRPIRILAGAFEPGLPERDLRLSPHHAVYIDGVLYEAQSLLNGATVIQEQSTKTVTYHHIELDQHDIMLAEGLAVESYLDTGSRNMFEDQQTIVLHPTFLGIASAEFCAPLVLEGALLEAAREKLLARAEALGFAKTEPVEMIARVDGKAIWPVANGEALAFVLPPAAETVQLVSAASVPAQVVAGAADTRRLGVAVVGLTLIEGMTRIGIDLADERHQGFHVMEAGGHRWTNGAASVRLPEHNGPAVLEVITAGQVARWAQSEAIAQTA
jgi:hypothetical protein